MLECDLCALMLKPVWLRLDFMVGRTSSALRRLINASLIGCDPWKRITEIILALMGLCCRDFEISMQAFGVTMIFSVVWMQGCYFYGGELWNQ